MKKIKNEVKYMRSVFLVSLCTMIIKESNLVSNSIFNVNHYIWSEEYFVNAEKIHYKIKFKKAIRKKKKESNKGVRKLAISKLTEGKVISISIFSIFPHYIWFVSNGGGSIFQLLCKLYATTWCIWKLVFWCW